MMLDDLVKTVRYVYPKGLIKVTCNAVFYEGTKWDPLSNTEQLNLLEKKFIKRENIMLIIWDAETVQYWAENKHLSFPRKLLRLLADKTSRRLTKNELKFYAIANYIGGITVGHTNWTMEITKGREAI